jgi:hypothetical protein
VVFGIEEQKQRMLPPLIRGGVQRSINQSCIRLAEADRWVISKYHAPKGVIAFADSGDMKKTLQA